LNVANGGPKRTTARRAKQDKTSTGKDRARPGPRQIKVRYSRAKTGPRHAKVRKKIGKEEGQEWVRSGTK
jgi:hypothetical protein